MSNIYKIIPVKSHAPSYSHEYCQKFVAIAKLSVIYIRRVYANFPPVYNEG